MVKILESNKQAYIVANGDGYIEDYTKISKSKAMELLSDIENDNISILDAKTLDTVGIALYGVCYDGDLVDYWEHSLKDALKDKGASSIVRVPEWDGEWFDWTTVWYNDDGLLY